MKRQRRLAGSLVKLLLFAHDGLVYELQGVIEWQTQSLGTGSAYNHAKRNNSRDPNHVHNSLLSPDQFISRDLPPIPRKSTHLPKRDYGRGLKVND